MHTAWWNPTQGWSVWGQVGSLVLPASTAVTAISRQSGCLDLFVVGGDGHIYTAWWNSAQGWSGWEPVGDLVVPVGTIVAATSRSPNQIDIFVVGSDGGMYTAWWNPTEQWSNWSAIGGHTFPAGTAAAALGYENDYLNVFATDVNGLVFTASWMQETGTWSGWEQVGTRVFRPETSPVNLYTTTPALDNLFGLIQDETVCYVFKPPVPVYQWAESGTNPYYYYSTNRNAPVQAGMQFQGVAFYAFDQTVPGTIPVFGYVSPQEQYFDAIDRTPNAGWTKQGTVWYAWAVDSGNPPGAVPLMEYESETATLYAIDPPRESGESTDELTYVGNTALVYGPGPVQIEIATAPLELAARIRARIPQTPADQSVIVDIYWYGVVLTLSHEATELVIGGFNLAKELAEKLVAAFGGENTEEGAAILTIVSTFLWAASGVLKLVDQGKGVYLTIPWTSLIPPTPPLGPFGIVIPTRR